MAFPVTALDVTVEAYYDATWNDITDYVFDRDGRNSITITRGRGNGSARCEPSRASLQLNNADGRFSPRNPNSPLFGKIGRNTKLRIKVTENAVTYTRFVGEVTAWPARWDPSESDVWVPLEACGILRRLQQGAPPLRSPLFRAISGIAAGDYQPIDYWPAEDGTTSTQIANAMPGGATSFPASGVSFSQGGPAGSAPLIVANAGFAANFFVRQYAATSRWALQWVMNVPAQPAALTTLFEVRSTGGSVATWRFQVEPDAFAGQDDYHWRGYDSTGSLIADTRVSMGGPGAPSEAEFYGGWYSWFAGVYESSGFMVATTGVSDGDLYELATVDSSPLAAGVSGAVRDFTVSVDASLDGIGLGHFSVFVDPAFHPFNDSHANARALNGWAGEQAHERVERLCREQGIAIETIGTQSALMGPQRIATLMDLLEDCANTDRGFLYEQREDVGLAYRCNASRFNQ